MNVSSDVAIARGCGLLAPAAARIWELATLFGVLFDVLQTVSFFLICKGTMTLNF
jgi:hypothetical protein